MKMAPAQRQMEPLTTVPPRQSAVLALLHPSPEGLALFFTVRSNSLRHHGGQISFPGGGVEAQDLTPQDAALRETEEELGFSTEGIDVLGKLTPLFIAPSHNIVHPYVGWTPEQPTLHPDPAEVASVLVVPIEVLLDPGTQSSCTWRLDGRELAAPCFAVKQATIWGATAMMLSELIAVIQSVPTGVPALAPERVRRCAPPDRRAELR
ncbi:MAG: CoA pyrophosphatase [Anaerolineae bacterium]|nr:CoA pyrophosphatase [Anaerolineae bacterium]